MDIVITWSTISAKAAQEVGAEMLSAVDVNSPSNAVVVPPSRLFRPRSDARRESMSARAELTASAVSLVAEASAMAASAFSFASSALAVELVLSLLESVLGSKSVLVLVAEEEVLEAELRPVRKGVLLDP